MLVLLLENALKYRHQCLTWMSCYIYILELGEKDEWNYLSSTKTALKTTQEIYFYSYIFITFPWIGTIIT